MPTIGSVWDTASWDSDAWAADTWDDAVAAIISEDVGVLWVAVLEEEEL